MMWQRAACRGALGGAEARGAGAEAWQTGLGATLARRPIAPPAARGGEHPEHAHHHVHKPPGAPVGLIVGLGAAVVAGIVILVGVLASRPQEPTLAELCSKLGMPPGGLPANFQVSQVDFINALGTPYHKAEDPSYTYLYYRIREGTAIIVVDRGGWDMSAVARIRRIYTR